MTYPEAGLSFAVRLRLLKQPIVDRQHFWQVVAKSSGEIMERWHKLRGEEVLFSCFFFLAMWDKAHQSHNTGKQSSEKTCEIASA